MNAPTKINTTLGASSMREWDVLVNGRSSGEIYKKYGRWWWHRSTYAVEPYSKGTTQIDIKAHIARLHRVEPSAVIFKKRAVQS